MPEYLLSDRTAHWLKNQINSRDMTSKRRDTPTLTGACYPVVAVVATVVGVIAPGVYLVSYENRVGLFIKQQTNIAVTLMNSLIPASNYVAGDKILVHNLECQVIPGEERQ